MKRIAILVPAATSALGASGAMTAPVGGAGDESSLIFGIRIPSGYRELRAHEEGRLNDLRAILGNDVAVMASGKEVL